MTRENLVPFSKRSKDEARELGRKGGRASGRTRRAQKTMKDTLNALLKLPIQDGKIQRKLNSVLSAKNLNITAEQAVLIAQIVEAINGNTKAAVFVRDTSGNRLPPDSVPDTSSDYADDGFVDAIKSSARGAWDDDPETKNDN